MIGLWDLPGSGFFSFSHGVSEDGSVVVGISNSASGFEAFRWTQADGMVGLGFLAGGVESEAFGVSADGSVIVGTGTTMDPRSEVRAFVWDTTVGIRDLRGVLISQCDDLTGWSLIESLDVSADGRSIIGRGINPGGQEEGWLARLGPRQVVPESSTLSLLALGLVVLLGHARGRGRS
jgi:probable HAF family extracellular repeat protein